MGIDDDENERQDALYAWQHAGGLDPCPHCKEYTLDRKKQWCRSCGLSAKEAWRAFYADEDKW